MRPVRARSSSSCRQRRPLPRRSIRSVLPRASPGSPASSAGSTGFAIDRERKSPRSPPTRVSRRPPGPRRQQEHRLDARPPAGAGPASAPGNGLSLDFLVQNPRNFRSRLSSPNASQPSRSWLTTAASPTSRAASSMVGRVHLAELGLGGECRLQALRSAQLRASWSRRRRSENTDRHVLDAFGTDRVMWASDWPPLDLVSDYATWKRISNVVLQALPNSQRRQVMEGTAARVYRFNT